MVRYLLLALALLLADATSANAGSVAEPSQCDALQVEAPDTSHRPTPRVFEVPRERQVPSHPHCLVASHALTVENVGRLAEVYGDGVLHQVQLNPHDIRLQQDAAKREEEMFHTLIETIKSGDRTSGKIKLLVYAHGGMVQHRNAVYDAELLTPYMRADHYTPLFLVWTSDFVSSYGNRLCCVLDGRESHIWQSYFGPARLFGDVVGGIARAPEAYGKQVVRFGDTLVPGIGASYRLSKSDFHSNLLCKDVLPGDASGWNGAWLVYPPYCKDDELNDTSQHLGVGYYLNTPTRAVTDWAQGAGASAWSNMVRRTRMAFRGSPALADIEHQAPNCEELTRLAAEDAYSDPKGDLSLERQSGAFERFFMRLSCEISRDDDFREHLEIDYFGHSMGAIIGDELMSRFPNLPYHRIVYMAAADSIRNFTIATMPVIARPDVTFYNLMLHPMAESQELHGGGSVPEGSLLEWIDEMFEGARSPDDRTLGKWTNVRDAHQYFSVDAMKNMRFRVFPRQRSTRGTAAYDAECIDISGDQRQAPPRRCHPIQHGDFNLYSFWRDRYLLGDLAQ